MSKNVNTLMNLTETGTSRYNDLGLDLDRKVYEAVKDILDKAIDGHGPIDIRMFTYLAMGAVQEVCIAKQL